MKYKICKPNLQEIQEIARSAEKLYEKVMKAANIQTEKKQSVYCNRNIWRVIEASYDNTNNEQILGLEKNEKLIAIASYVEELEHIILLGLAAHPENVSPFRKKKKYKGAGSNTLKEVIKIAKVKDKPIILEPYSSSISFYKQNGFVHTSGASSLILKRTKLRMTK